MKLSLLCILCFLGLALCAEKRIINGQAAELYSHPYIGSLQQNIRVSWREWQWMHTCGGSLVNRYWVVTAAHCVDMVSNLNNIRVELGALDLYSAANNYEQTIGVAEIHIHPDWNPEGSGMPNDIAMIKLRSPATLNNNTKIVSCASSSNQFEAGKDCVLAGWGQISTGTTAQTASTLKEVSIKKISSPECNALWSRYGGSINHKHICCHDAAPPVGDRPSACMGDSGGPMMCGVHHDILAGVTSWGQSTCAGDLPSVYTRVSEYLDFIKQYAEDVKVV